MRNSRLYIFLVLAVVALCGSAFADTVSMTFIGPGGNNSGGVYTYPYIFSVNGGSPVSLLCDTFDNEVVGGETWQATETSLLAGSQTGGGGLFAGQTLAYKAAGLIFEGILSGQINASAGNWAIWGLFSSNPQSNTAFVNSGALALEQQYLWLALFAPNSDFANLVLYTPVPGTQSWGNLPQEFIGYVAVAEPAQIMLMGLGLLACTLAFALRKHFGLKLVAGQA